MTDIQTQPACDTDVPNSASQQSPVDPPPCILVVDDDACIRHFNADVLKCLGYAVDAVEDGAAAWKVLQQKSYRLLITDHDMPQVTGLELLKKVRAARMALPVIIATASTVTHEFIRTRGVAPEATLLKPYTIEQLVGTVEIVLRTSERSP